MKLFKFILFLTVFPWTALAAPPPVASPSPSVSPGPSHPWNFNEFQRTMAASGRTSDLTEPEFLMVQAQKDEAVNNIKSYMKERIGEVDPDILKAFSQIPREYFQYHYQGKKRITPDTYEIPGHPWAIGYGSALSDYPGQIYMVQLAQPESTDTVLEIGTGSGYNIALLSRLVKDAYSIEIVRPLGHKVAKIFKPLGYDNIHTRVGDGYYGWSSVKGGFDIIIVTCAAQFVPPALLKQLKPHGRLIIPVGQPFRGQQTLYVYTKDAHEKVHCRKDMGVFFIPMTGKIRVEAKKKKALETTNKDGSN